MQYIHAILSNNIGKHKSTFDIPIVQYSLPSNHIVYNTTKTAFRATNVVVVSIKMSNIYISTVIMHIVSHVVMMKQSLNLPGTEILHTFGITAIATVEPLNNGHLETILLLVIERFSFGRGTKNVLKWTCWDQISLLVAQWLP